VSCPSSSSPFPPGHHRPSYPPTSPPPPRHHRARPGDLDRKSAAPHRIGMAGTSPAMTGEEGDDDSACHSRSSAPGYEPGISPGHPRLPEPHRRNDGDPRNRPGDDGKMSGEVTCAVVPGRASARARPAQERTQRPPLCPLLCRSWFQVPLRGPGTTGGGDVITPGCSGRKPLQGKGIHSAETAGGSPATASPPPARHGKGSDRDAEPSAKASLALDLK
jgi:hypothetical protein